MKAPAFCRLNAAPILGISLASLLVTHSAHAANGTWITDGDSQWGTAANWLGGVVADGSGFTANFNCVNLTADRTVTLDAARTLGNLVFGDPTTATAGGWMLDAGSGSYALALAGATPTITVNALGSGKVVTIGAELAGSAGLIKSGVGTLTLSAANTYSGTTGLNAGTLLVNGSLNGTPATALTFAGSATFNVSEAANVSQGMDVLTFSAGEGNVQSMNNGGTSSLTFSSLAARAAGATGNLVISGGTVGAPGSPGTPGTNNILVTTAPAAGQMIDRGLFYNGSTYAAYDAGGFVRAYAAGDASYVLAAAGATLGSPATTDNVELGGSISAQSTASGTVNTLNLAAFNLTMATSTDVLATNGLLSSGAAAATLGSSGGKLQPASAGGEMVVRVNGAADKLTITSIVQNNISAGLLTKTGAGTLILNSTANTFSGKIVVNGGTLQVSGINSLGAAPGSVTADFMTLNGATLSGPGGNPNFNYNTNRGITLGAAGGTFGSQLQGWQGPVTGSGNLYIANSQFRLNGGGSGGATGSYDNTYTGDTVVLAGGQVCPYRANSLQNSTLDLSYQANGMRNLNGISSIVLGGLKGSQNLDLGVAGATGGLSIGKNNQDTTYSGVLSGASSSLPIIKIGTGTLTFAGANTYAGTTTVNAGTLALGAAGSINNSTAVKLAAGAVLDSSAKATFAIPATQTFTFHVSGTGAGSSGRIRAAGLDITNAAVVFTVDSPLVDAVYVLADYTSLTGGSFALATPPSGYTISYDYNGGTQIALVSASGSPYDIWAAGFSNPPLSNTAAAADPDNDGRNNLTEFALNGDPRSASNSGYLRVATEDTNGDGLKELTLTLAVRNGSGSPVFSGSPSPSATVDGITYTIEGSLDLAFPNSSVSETSVPSGLPALPSGWEYRRFKLDASSGLPGKGFLRARISN